MNDQASLYERLGGYDAIAAVANALLPRLIADPVLGRFWEHRGQDGLIASDREQALGGVVCVGVQPLSLTSAQDDGSHDSSGPPTPIATGSRPRPVGSPSQNWTTRTRW